MSSGDAAANCYKIGLNDDPDANSIVITIHEKCK